MTANTERRYPRSYASKFADRCATKNPKAAKRMMARLVRKHSNLRDEHGLPMVRNLKSKATA